MSTQPQNGRLLSDKLGSRAILTAFAAMAALAISLPNLRAAAPSTKEAAAAASGTISALIQAGDPTFATDAGNAIENLVVSDTASIADDEIIVKTALGVISDAIVSGTSLLSGTTLLAGDAAIGKDIESNGTLEGLKKDGLVTILQDGIEGITGVKGKSTATAPLAAASFVEGILSNSSVPDGLSYPGFAVDILKRVKSNANVDELVSYQVALADSPSDLTTLATTLYKSYAADDVKITQGLLAATPPTSGTSEAARAADVSSLTTASIKNAAAIVQGAVFVDPHHTQDFTEASLDAINTFGGEKLVDSDAPTIAKDLGNTLGQDGDALTGVAEVFSELTGSGDLEVSRVATVATDLISGAVKSKVPASEFTGGAAGYGGGTLNVLNPVQETGSDLAGVLDLLATGIIAADSSVLDTPKGQKAVAAELGTLAEDIARFVKSEDFGSGPNTSVAVAAYLAGSLASTVNSLLENSEPVAVMDIDADIIKDVDAVVSKTVRPSVQQAVDSDSYASVGDIALPETTVTNL